MQRLKLLGLALIAVFAFSAVSAVMASAEELPNILFEAGNSFTVSGGEGKLKTAGLTITCEKVSGSGAETAGTEKMDGTITLLFEKCKSKIGVVEAECTSLAAGTTKGDIKVPANYNLRYLLPTSEKKVVFLVLLTEHLHLNCGVALVLVLGCYSSDDLESSFVNKLVASVTAKFLEKEGKPVVTEVDNLAATEMVKCNLTAMVGSQADETASEQAEATLTPKESQVLIMA